MTHQNTEKIREKLSLFGERFGELSARYDEFKIVMDRLASRIEEHVKDGEELIQVAREEQESGSDKSGLAKLTHKRNQGRINSKLIGAIERDLSVMTDVKDLTKRNLELISDTGNAIKRDVEELTEAIAATLDDFQEGNRNTLRILSDDVELLKQLMANKVLGTDIKKGTADRDG